MAFYNENLQLYLEKDVLGASLRANLFQKRDRIQFPGNEAPDNAAMWSIEFVSKNLTSAEIHYCNTKRDALGILHDLETFHQYCFTNDIRLVTNHKLLVAVSKKDIGSLSHRLQRILLHILNTTKQSCTNQDHNYS